MKDPGNTVAGHYSGAFAFWMYPSLATGAEINALRGELASGSEPALRQRMVELAEQQSNYNRGFAAAVPPNKWRGFHERMSEALANFDVVSGELKASSTEALASLLDKLESAHATLRHRVIDCYAQSPSCR